MKTIRRHLVVLLSAAVAVLSISACSDGGAQSTERETDTAAQSTERETDAAESRLEDNSAAAAEEAKLIGFVDDGDIVRYFNSEGEMLTGWQTIDGEVYCFGDEGSMMTGKTEIDGIVYFFSDNGLLGKGWYTVNDTTYYLGDDGVVQTGWLTLDECIYYFDENGVMSKGLTSVEGNTYYFGDDGVRKTGWQTIDSNLYYLGSDGAMAVGWTTVEGISYYMLEDGKTAFGETTIDGVSYCFGDDGILKNGWLDGVYYENGYVMSGLQKINGAYYYLDSEGRLSGGWHTIDGSKYYFDKNGKAITGWQTIDGKKMYFDSNGKMAIGWRTISGKRYYFYESGTMAVSVIIGSSTIGSDGAATDRFDKITTNNLDEYIEILLNTYGRTLRSVYNYVHDKYKYKYRDKIEEGTSIENIDSMACRMLNYGSGACWDYAALTYKMVTALGYNVQIVVGKGMYYSEHNWLVIEVEPGVWRHMDTQRKSLEVYLVTDTQLEEWDSDESLGVRYQWDHDIYPTAE